MSKRVVFESFGDPSVLKIVDVPSPHPDAGQVRVRVKAAGVQPADVRLRSGAFQGFFEAHFPQGLGGEFAGVIDEVGDGATGRTVGDEVIGWVSAAAYAEYVVVAATDIAAKPANMPWEHAGVLSASGQTASTALTELNVGPGDVVLIHAAAGGVGTFAVQLAKELGATVIGTANERNHDYLRELGAIPVAYGPGLTDRVRALTPTVDAALDAHGGEEAISVSIDLVADRTRIGTLTAFDAVEKHGIKRIGTQRSATRLMELAELYSKGRLAIHIQDAYPLEQAADAHRAIEGGHVRGKVVLITDAR